VKEFAIIENYFKDRGYKRKDVILGVGDDAALTKVPAGQLLVVTTDTLVSGVHFHEYAPAESVAHKALTVNLSDLAAMGAEPAWFSLSLSLPDYDEDWLRRFSSTLDKLSHYYHLQLIGGDTVQGPLAVTITAQGFVAEEQALSRSGAKPGDWLYVTGELGDAALGLDILNEKMRVSGSFRDLALERFNYPNPRALVGTALRRIASACIDISDGLLADLRHVLRQSECGATINIQNLPLSRALTATLTSEQAYAYALSGGDDYELLFTVSEEQKSNLGTVMNDFNLPVTCIGQLNGVKDSISLSLNGESYHYQGKGYEHFA
jgi:thiamine-monophosphate kinase